MLLSKHVECAFDDAASDKLESAMLHACIAIDQTGKKLGLSSKVRERFVGCLRSYYWIIEPMMGGINLVETRFGNTGVKGSIDCELPDLADVVYKVHRCNHAHGEEVPLTFAVTRSEADRALWMSGPGMLHIPDRILWALLAVAVFSRANADQTGGGSTFLTLGGNKFPVSEWWGREDDFRPTAERCNQLRVTLQPLSPQTPSKR